MPASPYAFSEMVQKDFSILCYIMCSGALCSIFHEKTVARLPFSMLANECGACLSEASSLGARVDERMGQIGNAVGLERNILHKAQLL